MIALLSVLGVVEVVGVSIIGRVRSGDSSNEAGDEGETLVCLVFYLGLSRLRGLGLKPGLRTSALGGGTHTLSDNQLVYRR